MSEWIKTDDLQYIKKKKDGIYTIVEARCVGNVYVVLRGEVIIANWLDSDKNYNSDCKKIIESYYGSVTYFEANYSDEEFREQVLAELIFEEVLNWDEDFYEIVTENEVEQKLEEYKKM